MHPLSGEIVDADLATMQALASIEVLAVGAYTAVQDAAMSGFLGTVPPAIMSYVALARAHHQIDLDAWNEALVRAGRPAVDVAPVGAADELNAQLASTIDAVGAARVTLTVERIAAAAYLQALGTLASESTVLFAGSVFSVDQQHIAVLLFALGQYPAPDAFATAELAARSA